jgi:hypothetical protein
MGNSTSNEPEMTTFIRVEVLVKDLQECSDAGPVEGFLGFVKWCAVVHHGNANGVFEAMLTHFRLHLTTADGVVFVLERNQTGVHFRPHGESDEDHKGFVSTLTWEGAIKQDRIYSYVEEQRQSEYSIISKNCKHFAYDFYRYVLKCEEGFPAFCQRAEGQFRSQRG